MSFILRTEEIIENIKKLKDFMQEQKLDAFYVSSFDPFLNEYVPMIDCHRYYFTGFSGSVAEALFYKDQKVRLYVDGRYHEQADNEVNHDYIDVVKVAAHESLQSALLNDLNKLCPESIGIEGERTSLGLYEKISKNNPVKVYSENELSKFISFQKRDDFKAIKHLSVELTGEDTAEKLKRINLKMNEAFFVTAIDSVSWITNCRAYQLPHLSSVVAKALVTKEKVFVYKNDSMPIDESVKNNTFIEFIDVERIREHIEGLNNAHHFSKIFYQPSMQNVSDFNILKTIFNTDVLHADELSLVKYHSIKTPLEIKVYEDSFLRSDKAVFNTIKKVKEMMINHEDLSEKGIYDLTTKMYQQEGAISQSFNTISGVGANGSIIHYGSPKDRVRVKPDDMILLDSGAYYEAGIATDKTRTFMASNLEGNQKQKEIYTLVLKATLALSNAVFPSGVSGAHIDSIARLALYQRGYDYAHGTGHGVGIHVHESGARISTHSQVPMYAGQVVSIEPGIYIPGFGGVRLENIALVEKHSKFENFLCFRSLVYIGFEPLLIEESMLNEQEKKWLMEYEQECDKRGTRF